MLLVYRPNITYLRYYLCCIDVVTAGMGWNMTMLGCTVYSFTIHVAYRHTLYL